MVLIARAWRLQRASWTRHTTLNSGQSSFPIRSARYYSMAPSFNRIMRFVPKDDPSKILLGEPEDECLDIGKALYEGKTTVKARVYSGTSALDAGEATDDVVEVQRVLSPLTEEEIGTIRCIGLNYMQHAKEASMLGDLPKVPTLFMKPSTALNNPYPSKVPIPKLSQETETADFESELAIIIGKECKNVSEADALDYVLGYAAANDVSCRHAQFASSQWGFSKGFDGSAPLGPVIVSTKAVPDVGKLRIRGILNGEVMQDCGIDDLIFPVAKLVSFLSQSTTLKPGVTILSGTPHGVGFVREPKLSLKDGDTFSVEILPHIGSLINVFEHEK